MSHVSIRVLVPSLLALVLSAGAAHSQGSVLLVKSPNGPFTSIQAAVDAAQDGDTILVGSGAYAPFSIAGRSLTVTAADGAAVTVFNGGEADVRSEVLDLQADDVVVLRGLKLHGLHVADSAGAVWVENCEVLTAIPALLVESSDSVVLVRDTVTGKTGFNDTSGAGLPPHPSGKAARFSDSVVAMFDCSVTGGAGKSLATTAPGTVAGPDDGMAAIELHGGELRLSGGSVQGGAGGNGGFHMFGCTGGRNGGDGIELVDVSPALVVHDAAVTGGPAGFTPDNCEFSTPGTPGDPLQVSSGTVTNVPGSARRLELSGPVLEHNMLQLSVAGVPGDLVLVLVGLQPDLALKPVHVGSLLVPSPLLLVGLGSLGNPATLELTILMPELGPQVSTVHAFVQGAFKPAAGGTVLGSGSVLIALDSNL